MVVFLIILISFLLILTLLNFQATENEYFAFSQKTKLIRFMNQKTNNYINSIEEQFLSKNPSLNRYIGDKVFLKLILPSLIIITLSSGVICPLLTKGYLIGVLSPIIATAYILRFFYYHASNFREILLSDLERNFQLIRNNLSSGTTLDYALNFTVNNSQSSLILDDLKSFININQRNILEYFPLWFKSLEKKFNLKDLTGPSQILALQLKFNDNQEEAMVLATENLAHAISSRKQQENTIFIAFISLDFFVIMFLGILFWVLPSLNSAAGSNWWSSTDRPLVIFASASLLWLIYSLVVYFCWRRMN